jgi:O-antigen ligase
MLALGIGFVAILVAGIAIFQHEVFSDAFSSIVSTVVYKDKDPTEGLLASRKSPWQDAVDEISSHFWFGTGFGTSDTGQATTGRLARFATDSSASTEHGSSYLAIATWVGMVGVLPFLLLLGFLLAKTVQTLLWMHRTGNPSHPAVPLAMVMLCGMIHAGFEDWLFAPGYYLCVFYWSMAFVFIDQVSWSKTAASREPFLWATPHFRHDLGAVAPSR